MSTNSRVDHSPMYTATAFVVDLILEAAGESLSRGFLNRW